MREKALEAVYLLAAVGIVGGGLYLLLDKAAPIVSVRPEQAQQSAATAPAPHASEPRPAPREEPSGSPIYRCDRGGAVVYSDTPCEGGRVVDVQVTQGFQAERYRPAPARDSAGVTPPLLTSAQSAVATNAGLCEQINKAIEGIDAAARAGGSIQYMEDLKERRRKLVEQRQEHRC